MDICDDKETEQNTVTEDEVMQDGEEESLKKDEERMDGVKMEEETRDGKKEQKEFDMEENFVETNYWISENLPVSIDEWVRFVFLLFSFLEMKLYLYPKEQIIATLTVESINHKRCSNFSQKLFKVGKCDYLNLFQR